MRAAITGAVLAGVLAVAASAVPVGAAGRAGPTTATGVTKAAAPYCGITWGSAPKTREATRISSLVGVTTTRESCWDRTTFEFDGPVDGYLVDYADHVYTEGEGTDLVPYTAGAVHLRVSLQSNARTFPARGGQHVATVVPYRTMRDVVYGGWFEGHTLFAVGVRARLSFRVLSAAGPGTHSRIIIDVAHQW